MTIGRLDFDQITERDLRSLIETGVPEGVAIDYKADRYSGNDEGVKEFLKDLSSLANTAGGHLIVGLKEEEGVPINITPVTGDADKEIQRLESLARDGITPRISGVRMRAVPTEGGFVLLIRIPRSWNPPHQVSARRTNRFYVRNSAGAHEVSVDELRSLFNVAATTQDRTRAFREERLAKISAGSAPVVLANDRGKLVLHIIPFSAFSTREGIDLRQAYQMGMAFQPMGSSGYTPRYNFDGLIHVRGGDHCYGYTQIFRNGSIEAVKVRSVFAQPNGLYIPTLDMDKFILKAMTDYLNGLQRLDVPPPLTAMITIDGVYGAVLGVDERLRSLEDLQPIQQNVLELPEILIEDYGDSRRYQRAARPAFDALWNAGGYAASKHFDQDGNWTGPP